MKNFLFILLFIFIFLIITEVKQANEIKENFYFNNYMVNACTMDMAKDNTIICD